MQFGIEQILRESPIIPVVNFTSLESIPDVMQRLTNQGVKCIEITLRSEIAWEAIEWVKTNYPNFSVGVGTIVDVEQISKAAELGVDFLVSPGTTPALFDAFRSARIPFLPGVSNPTNIISALEEKCNFLKLFPAHLVGGMEALKAYGAVFPQVKFCPTGGINENDYKDYLALPNVLSVGGSWVAKSGR